MTSGIKTVIYPVNDLAAAKALFTGVIGAQPDSDAPYYVGWKVEGRDIGLDPTGHSKGMTGPVMYFHVDDIEATLNALLDAGATMVQEVTDVGGGRLIASVKDADGNPIGVLQDT
jgi:predicted enzyme related to lactoylglutathione lyase